MDFILPEEKATAIFEEVTRYKKSHNKLVDRYKEWMHNMKPVTLNLTKYEVLFLQSLANAVTGEPNATAEEGIRALLNAFIKGTVLPSSEPLVIDATMRIAEEGDEE